MTIFNVISLFGGLALFLYGMDVMGDGLKNNSGPALKRVLEKVTGNVVAGVLVGTVVTAVIQSSHATIVLTVGLIGAGVLNLKQAAAIVMGANIGTTATAQIIRLMDLESGGNAVLEFFKPSTLAPLAAIAGIVLLMFLKTEHLKGVGTILMGFGILFIGLLNMTAAVAPLAESRAFADLLSRFSDMPLVSILIGLGLTVILQSSSAMIGMIQALSVTGTMTFNLIYPLIMGINLGTCVSTALLCSVGSENRDSKRTGIVHIVFNVIGTILFMTAMTLLKSAGAFPTLWGAVADSGMIANFQTIFNLFTAIALIPFTNLLVALARKIIPDREEQEEAWSGLRTLDEKLYVSPAVALRQCHAGVARMGELARVNLLLSFEQLEHWRGDASDLLMKREEALDQFTDHAENYLVNLSPQVELLSDRKEMTVLLQTLTDFERLGDYATNLDELGQQLMRDEIGFSEGAASELKLLRNAVEEIVETTVRAFRDTNIPLARQVEPLEEVIDELVAEMKDRHILRLQEGGCTVAGGLLFQELLTNLERVSDQCSNVAVFLIGLEDEKVLRAHHEYLTELHKGGDSDYIARFREKWDIYVSPLKGEN